jgi:hypothetical protein
MDRSLESCGSERIGREEEGMSSGRAEWGQGGKASLANTVDDDILEYILGKLRARMAARIGHFSSRSKHTDASLNERVDDLTEGGVGRTLEKEGED